TPGRPPYRLYALSNVASFLALLSYPTLVEPTMTRRMQALVWSICLAVFAVVCAYCAINSTTPGSERNRDDPDSSARRAAESGSSAYLRNGRDDIWWLLLPAGASLLLLAVTNKICQDVAVVPLLWVLPLAIYLLSFVICFDSPRWYDRRVFVPLLLIALAIACWAAFPGHEEWSIPLRVAAYALALFACCMTCHGELYRLKPPPARLTAFYLLIAAGGALGGLLVALVAPMIFTGYSELQIGLMLAFTLLLVALFRDPKSLIYHGRRPVLWLAMIIAGVALALLLWITATPHLAGSRMLAQMRNFYGVLTLYRQGSGEAETVLLQHGGVTHGLQLTTPSLRRQPTAYYGPQSGVGVALRSLPALQPHRVGAIGLGAGTIAAYARAGDGYRFYEINPMVIDIARSRFTFLGDCLGHVEVVPGDGRLSLENEPDRHFDLLAVDAFSGDAIPVHLLTAECFEVYLRRLAPRGIIAIHVSNQHLDLEPVVRKLAAHAGLACVLVHATPVNDPFQYESRWMLLARDAASLDVEPIKSAVSPAEARREVPLWTDDYSDLIRILR
ncbi:MAG TPA: fused MFS/spermidine synthase, partial [Tepidisphaeraceae bacterium]|nr:fused MFS/spermidine synthase [Tepidisphaeraceae bacterium]